MKLPERTATDLEIDRLWHWMAVASTPESKARWRERYERAIRERDAQRMANTEPRA